MILTEYGRGVEHEYGIVSYPLGGINQRLLVDSALNLLRDEGLTSGVAWSIQDEIGNREYEIGLAKLWAIDAGPFPQAFNGMRVYDDTVHFEVSTPLYRRPLDALTYSRVGELLVYKACQRAKERFGITVNGYKNNISTLCGEGLFDSVAYGTHGNIAVSRSVCSQERWKDVRKALTAYIVARCPLIGAGDMVPVTKRRGALVFTEGRLTGDELRFAISPRAGFIRQVSTLDTTLNRGLLNTRDEPHAEQSRFWRLHDINLEAVRCDFQILLVDVLHTFIIAAFEAGLLSDAPQIRDPVSAIANLSLDTDSFTWKVRLDDGKEADAISDILAEFYLKRIGRLVDERGSAIDKEAFNWLQQVVEKLVARDIDAFVWGLDWVTKRRLLEEYGSSGEEALLVCNQYAYVDGSVGYYTGEAHDWREYDSLFSPEASFAFAREHVPWIEWGGVPDRVQHGLMNSPQDTREFLRTGLLKKFEHSISRISWSKIYFDNGLVAELPDPLGYTVEECADLLNSAKSPQEVISGLKELSEAYKKQNYRGGSHVSS